MTDDRPYGDPQRAANIRWESTTGTLRRRFFEGVGALLGAAAWPFKKAGGLLIDLGRDSIDLGYESYTFGKRLSRFRRDD